MYHGSNVCTTCGGDAASLPDSYYSVCEWSGNVVAASSKKPGAIGAVGAGFTDIT